MSDMTSCFILLSEWHRTSLLTLDEIKTGINFLAVMQQGSHELYDIALKLYDLDLALVTAQGMEFSIYFPNFEKWFFESKLWSVGPGHHIPKL